MIDWSKDVEFTHTGTKVHHRAAPEIGDGTMLLIYWKSPKTGNTLCEIVDRYGRKENGLRLAVRNVPEKIVERYCVWDDGQIRNANDPCGHGIAKLTIAIEDGVVTADIEKP